MNKTTRRPARRRRRKTKPEPAPWPPTQHSLPSLEVLLAIDSNEVPTITTEVLPVVPILVMPAVTDSIPF